MRSVEFTKMHGTGNDFIIVDDLENHYNTWDSRFVCEMCTRRTGIGADGLLVLKKSSSADFRMHYFNSDGKESEMCINGSRCISFFAFQKGYIKEVFTFEAGDGIHQGRIQSGHSVFVEVKLKEAVTESRTIPVDFKLPEGIYFRNFINTGVPHLVLECSDLEHIPVSDLGSKLRFHPYYQPEGTNVNFVEVHKSHRQDSLRIRTFERGVDAETLSCGTGATAAVLTFFKSLNRSNGDKSRLAVETRGGTLYVHLENRGEIIQLEGPVAIVYQGIYTREDYS